MQKQKTTEGFYQFLKKISGNHLDYITDLSDIRAKRPEVSDFPKERVLTKDLLIWSKQQQQPYVAFMWTQCAHMPYNSPITPFGTATKIDKYDNCLANLDDSIQVLVEGLKKQGKLDNTIIMIAGDHGEALGEHLDWGHGNYLYEHSLRYPALFYNPKIFNQQIDLYQRFQFKDFAATLLYLFDLEGTKPLGQAINIFTKTATDPIYLSNVYLDYKLGLIFDHFKFVYRPKYNITYLYDLTKDPHEEINLIQTKSETEIEALKQKVLEWYQYQVHYIQTFITEF
jgi:arylsulfatase A-like enzyme